MMKYKEMQLLQRMSNTRVIITWNFQSVFGVKFFFFHFNASSGAGSDRPRTSFNLVLVLVISSRLDHIKNENN